MKTDLKVSVIGQIAITVRDVADALSFYRDALGLELLFSPNPNLAFLKAGDVRIMLSTPQGAGSVGHNSILYFTVPDITEAHETIVARGAKSERVPQLAAQMEDHELWTSFLRDPDDNLVGLMEERR
jgi:predicted enzyme related to lactoylglutathione lyase